MRDFITIEGLGWVPSWVIGIAIIVLAILLALAFHSLLLRLARRWVGPDRRFLNMLLLRTAGPSRLGLVIVAASVALRIAPLEYRIVSAIAQILTIVFILLVGWAAVTAIKLATDLYLGRLRSRSDTHENLMARGQITQTRILSRTATVIVMLIAFAAALMTIEPVRQYGVSLLAAGGAAGLVVGLAAQPLLSNIIAGLQLAVTQPIRIDDAVIVEGEWGTVEEITSTYVVIKIWDWRRLVVPLKYFMERPFQNWTRDTASLIGSVILYVDYRAPVATIREELQRIAEASRLWDRNVVGLQVIEVSERTMQLRALVSARNAGTAFDLRCEVRERLIDFLQREHREALPVQRQEGLLSADVALRRDGPIEDATSQPAASLEGPPADQQRDLLSGERRPA